MPLQQQQPKKLVVDICKNIPKPPTNHRIVGFKLSEPKVRISPDYEEKKKRKKSYDLPRQMPKHVKEFTFN